MPLLSKSLDGIEAIFLDLDGTIYLGGEPIEGALDFLERLDQRGIRRFFLSNNSSKSVSQYLDKLTSMGVPATEQDSMSIDTVFIMSYSASSEKVRPKALMSSILS